MNKDEHYMRRALELAELGATRTSPNPMVGAVIVHQDRIIGEGWHKNYGGPHAEVHAIDSVEDSGLLPESTIYVTLEPCAHFGKTPPCSDLLIEKGVRRVVVGITDSNPQVAGQGIRRMQDAGIAVSTNVLRQACYELNRPFFVRQRWRRPFILLKWAQTADGFIARSDYSSKWISSKESRTLVHKWRAEADAILVGKNTALYDNPSLTVREWSGHDPVRVVIDREHVLPNDLTVFQLAPPTICYTRLHSHIADPVEWVALGPDITWDKIFDDLHRREIGSVLVEGGAAILNSLIKENLWDEARIFVAETRFDQGINAPVIPLSHLEETIQLPDVLYRYINRKSDG